MGRAQELRIQIQEFKNKANVWSKNPTSYTPGENLKSVLLGCIILSSQDLKKKCTLISDYMDKTKQKSREQFRGWCHSQDNPVSPELRNYKEDTSIPFEGGFSHDRPATKALSLVPLPPTPPCSWLDLCCMSISVHTLWPNHSSSSQQLSSLSNSAFVINLNHQNSYLLSEFGVLFFTVKRKHFIKVCFLPFPFLPF